MEANKKKEKKVKKPKDIKYCHFDIEKETNYFIVILDRSFLVYDKINKKSIKEIKKIHKWLDNIIKYLENYNENISNS